jgi:ATP synthase protein I
MVVLNFRQPWMGAEMEKYSKVTKQDKKNVMRAIGYMSHIAISMAACVLIGVLLGLFLDNRLGTDPWMVVIFSILGCLSAFKAMIDIAKKF